MSTITNPQRIDLNGTGRHLEAPADAALKPGHLLKFNSDGEVLKHATSGGPSELLVAKEDALQGKTTLVLGPSGAGKSSLINALVPGAAAQTGEISRALNSGKHTTTSTMIGVEKPAMPAS